MDVPEKDYIFDVRVPFQEKTLQIFEYQREHNPVYSRFCKALGINKVENIEEIPLLPIQAFKDAEVITALENSTLKTHNSKLYFQSSGTTGMQRSRHYIKDPQIYRESILKGMKHFYNLDEYVIWAYTPGFNDNPHSSLIWMLNTLIENDASGLSRFLEVGAAFDIDGAKKIQESGKKLMLFGAAFGLLDLAQSVKSSQSVLSVIIETGGMKTHRREMSREELHQQLAEGFGLVKEMVHSEYGMAELLSQAYSLGDEWFECVPWMQVSIRNPQNPLEKMSYGQEGLIGVTDLANVHSCSFILTGDKGIQNEKGQFQVLGRWNPQNLRGCNFLIDVD